MKNNVTINGVDYTGVGDLVIKDGVVIIDGVVVSERSPIKVEVNGNINSLSVDYGEVTAGGVGNISTMSGDVNCWDVSGNVSTMSGDVYAVSIQGKTSTMSGDIYK